MALWIIRTIGRLRPFLAVPEPTPAQPHLLVPQMCDCRRQFAKVAEIGLGFGRRGHELLRKLATRHLRLVAECCYNAISSLRSLLRSSLGSSLGAGLGAIVWMRTAST